jgi:hypothetical protein
MIWVRVHPTANSSVGVNARNIEPSALGAVRLRRLDGSGAGLVSSRLGSALIFAALTLAVWVAGLFAADVRIICRLV